MFADDKEVRAAWGALNKLYHTISNPNDKDCKTIAQAQYKLLESMACSLGYKKKISWETIQNPYIPDGMTESIEQQKLQQQIYFNTLESVGQIIKNQSSK